MNFQKNRPDELELNITPLIDVVFLLLIFFMVSTTFDDKSAMNITLPKASKEIVDVKLGAINIFIDAQSRIYVNEKKLLNSQVSTIKEVIYDIVAEIPDAHIIISADRATPYQMMIKTLDVARQLGLINITFATRIDEEDY